MPPVIDLADGRKLWIHPQPTEPMTSAHCGWSKAGRQAWLEGAAAAQPAEVFQRLCDRIAKYLDLPKEHAPGMVSTLALWALLELLLPRMGCGLLSVHRRPAEQRQDAGVRDSHAAGVPADRIVEHDRGHAVPHAAQPRGRAAVRRSRAPAADHARTWANCCRCCWPATSGAGRRSARRPWATGASRRWRSTCMGRKGWRASPDCRPRWRAAVSP